MSRKFSAAFAAGSLFVAIVVVVLVNPLARSNGDRHSPDQEQVAFQSHTKKRPSLDVSSEAGHGSPATAADGGETTTPVTPQARYQVRVSNIDGTVEDLLEREFSGDPNASYELVARTVDCLMGTSRRNCDYYEMTVDQSAERLVHAAENGVVAAQVNYLSNYELISSRTGESIDAQDAADRYVEYLQAAKGEGSADAMYLLGLMGVSGPGGRPRRDVEGSISNLDRLDAVAHLVASAEIYSQVSDGGVEVSNAETELSKLKPREVDEVRRIAAELLSRDSCCFVVKRRKQNESRSDESKSQEG